MSAHTPPPSITVRWMGPTQKSQPQPSELTGGAPREGSPRVIDGDLALPSPGQPISDRKGA